MPIANDVPLALANRFTVKVDAPGEIDLGSWAKVDGLDVTFDVVEYRAGDAWNSRWYCPGATKYSTVKLSRAVTADTEKVRKWLSDTAKSHRSRCRVPVGSWATMCTIAPSSSTTGWTRAVA